MSHVSNARSSIPRCCARTGRHPSALVSIEAPEIGIQTTGDGGRSPSPIHASARPPAGRCPGAAPT